MKEFWSATKKSCAGESGEGERGGRGRMREREGERGREREGEGEGVFASNGLKESSF